MINGMYILCCMGVLYIVLVEYNEDVPLELYISL